MLFIDVVGAFANVARPLIIDVDLPDEYIVYLFKSLNFSEEVFEEFRDTLKSTSAMTEADVPIAIQDLLRPFILNTWFNVKNCSGIVQYTKGSGAGNPLADIFFTFAIAKVLNQCRLVLVEKGLCEHVDSENDCPLVWTSPESSSIDDGTSYVDDDVIHCTDPDPHPVVHKSICIAKVVFHVFHILLECEDEGHIPVSLAHCAGIWLENLGHIQALKL